jgi:putative hydrolase of the HAD superfamily
VSFPVLAITLDLDDTLWPIGPAINRAEEQLDAWMKAHAPRSFARWPQAKRRKLREQVDRERPHLSHDMTVQRQWMLARMLAEAGDDTALMPAAYEAYFAGRCDVKHYGDSVPALDRLAARVPLAAVSNGNADLQRIGLMHLFRFQLGAREHGKAKPSACIFHAACAQLEVAPMHVLHVGDDPEADVIGAHRAGLRTCWINRERRTWTHRDVQPDLQFTNLAALADWLDATHPTS